jgi:hypothetical protein
MEDAELITLHKALWKPGSISITAGEAVFIKHLIARCKPKVFLELGTAAGVSTVLIFKVLSDVTNGRMITVDLNRNFVGGTDKPTGYMIDEHIASDDRLTRIVGVTSADLDSSVTSGIEMCFIDANHQHPWPTLDTLFLWPLIAQRGVLIYHDLRLYQKAQGAPGIGPKFLFDQFPNEGKTVISDPDRNVFSLIKSHSDADFHRWMIDSLLLPWTLKRALSLSMATKIAKRLSELYPQSVANAFSIAFDRYNANTAGG